MVTLSIVVNSFPYLWFVALMFDQTLDAYHMKDL
jgi:hypothetical protein